MNKHNGKWNKVEILLTSALVCTLSMLACLVAYRYDNKFTAPGPRAENGVLALNEQTLADYPYVFLIDSWEYYGGRLLSPHDFAENPPLPDKYIFVRRFGGFEAGDKDASPHGSASYRLNIVIPEDTNTYTLGLPEIFSAYRLYINGKQVKVMGDPDPQNYRPETGNQTITIEAGENIEILLAVSDFSHQFSGMVFAPVFGKTKAVTDILNMNFFFRSALCAIALTIGLLSAFIGYLSGKNKLSFLYALLCVFFVGFACYPITRTLFYGFQPQYVIESFSFCAMLAVTMLLTEMMSGSKHKVSFVFILFGFLVCGIAAASPFLWRLGNLQIMLAYSTLISAYQWITAAFITMTTVRNKLKHAVSGALYYGILIFSSALIMNRILRLHEPIITGAFIELASFALIISFGIVIGQDVSKWYKETVILTERTNSMERLYQTQQTYFAAMKQEMEASNKMRHDIRHHFTIIDSFVKNRQYDKLSDYVSEFTISPQNTETVIFCPIDVIDVLSHHYSTLAAQNGISFDMRCDLDVDGCEQTRVNMSDADLCCLYSNLMENALEACLRVKTGEREILVAVVRPGSGNLTIRIKNSADSIAGKAGDTFLSSKAKGRMGYGLLSIRSIAEKYNGTTSFKWYESECLFESKVTISV